MAEPSGIRVRRADWVRDKSSLRAVRAQVFMHEQGVPAALEWDEFDACSVHVLAEAGPQAIGTGRLLPDGHIGRMAVLAEWRGRGVGSALLRALIGLAREAGHREALLSAQAHAAAFYERFGFARRGGEYLEAGILHVSMTRHL